MNGNSIKKKKLPVTNILGPVDNLESYVKADWWKEIFNANYLRTDGDVVENQAATQMEIDLFLDILKAEKTHHILDLCCGQGRHTLELARRGFTRLTGLDRSHYLISRARNINRKRGTPAVFKEGDARKLPFANDSFDFVIIPGNSFGYFESANDDLRVLSEVRRVLKPYGRVLIDITDGDYMRSHFQARSWEWIDSSYFVCRERELSSDAQRLVSREVITHVQKGVIADQFYAERLYSSEAIQSLLSRVGYSSIAVHQQYQTESSRNQDLGMMARRILVTGTVTKDWSQQRHAAKKSYNIAVLMGDPQLSDLVKPDGSFDEDDFHTIHELKKALGQLREYKFQYLDNHASMLGDLSRIKKEVDFVLNLCDEGFNNEARKELHVPAVLEMLQIPYTGGNPQCLAYCYDKSLVRGIAKESDIPVPEGYVIKPEDTVFFDLPISFPVIVKPNFGDSSVGITMESVCYDVKALESAILHVREIVGYDKPVLVEQYLTGKDLSVGIIGNPPEFYNVLPVIEEDYSSLPEGLPKICAYEAKWVPGSPYWGLKSVPVQLDEATERYLVASCIKLFERLECRDYARFDWRLDDNGTPRLLEVNPNPGWCWDGHLAKMAAIAGMSYSDMLGEILKAAIQRLNIQERWRKVLERQEILIEGQPGGQP
jgi:D-alanine-D-alanine ligase